MKHAKTGIFVFATKTSHSIFQK